MEVSLHFLFGQISIQRPVWCPQLPQRLIICIVSLPEQAEELPSTGCTADLLLSMHQSIASGIRLCRILLLIPGIALVTSLRDMIVGDTISGLLGACEALLRAIAIAAGCALVLMQLGGAG